MFVRTASLFAGQPVSVEQKLRQCFVARRTEQSQMRKKKPRRRRIRTADVLHGVGAALRARALLEALRRRQQQPKLLQLFNEESLCDVIQNAIEMQQKHDQRPTDRWRSLESRCAGAVR